MNNLDLLALMHTRALSQRRDQPTPRDWADVLATFPLVAEAGKRGLRKLARSATFAEFAAGETILFAGELEDSLYITLSGHARARSRGKSRVLHAGEYFGEVALIDGLPRSATVVAMSHVHVMKLPPRSVLRLARRHPALTLTMLKNLTTRLRGLETEGARVA